MEMQGYKIIPPEGMECFMDGSEIKFKPIETKSEVSCYTDVAKKLFKKKRGFYLTSEGAVKETTMYTAYFLLNNCTSQKQGKKVLAINALLNVAKYLNDGWTPHWNNSGEYKYYIYINRAGNLDIGYVFSSCDSLVYFRTQENAIKAIKILGEDAIRTALSTDY